jgi:hypothetical protein
MTLLRERQGGQVRDLPAFFILGGGLDGPLPNLPQKKLAPAKPALEQGR